MGSVLYEGSDGWTRHPGRTAFEIQVPPGRSSVEVGLAIVGLLVNEHGAVLERADMYRDGSGGFALSIRRVDPERAA